MKEPARLGNLDGRRIIVVPGQVYINSHRSRYVNIYEDQVITRRNESEQSVVCMAVYIWWQDARSYITIG